MFDSKAGTNVLEEKYTHELLAVLLLNGTQRKTTLARAVTMSSTVHSKIDLLEKAGFVSTQADKYDKNTKWVSLTPTGENVAKTLCDLDRTITEMQNNQ
jgi:DNA-binding MarR family transcriptional regulator